MSLLIGRLFVLSIIDIRSGLHIGGPHRFTWNWQVQRRLLVTALPFGIISCLGVLNMNIPRYFIEYDLSRHDLGIFSAVASLVGSGNLIIAALASCAIVPLANAWANQHTHEYNALYRRFIAASVAMGMGGVLIALLGGDRILKLLFSADYVGNSGVLARVMVAGALGYVVSAQGYTMTAARKVREQIPALIGSSLVTGLSSWLVVPRRGLAGAAEAWILGAFFLFVYNAFLLARLSGSSHEHTRVWGDAALAGTIKTD